jgi:4-deoxy-L-threo-5-hexosulose-uronate ketol-isomerase
METSEFKEIKMEIRYALHADHFKTLTTAETRKHLLIESLFGQDEATMVYSHVDRIIVGGVSPVRESVSLGVSKALGVNYFLERREIGIINIGSDGAVIVDGQENILKRKECLYVGMGAKEIAFKSCDKNAPAKFYFNSTPAHVTHPAVKITKENAKRIDLGTNEEANRRTIYQLIHPNVMKSCQLVMGFTELAAGSVWNTMPCHIHDRRMEVYCYFDIPDESVVFHLMGEPRETRHIVVRNGEAVISPSWSIHSGVGTKNYTFIWGMAGENQTFTDMDEVPMYELR